MLHADERHVYLHKNNVFLLVQGTQQTDCQNNYKAFGGKTGTVLQQVKPKVVNHCIAS
jgi:hypothetical protein